MPSVFEEHRQMADIKTAEFQRGLKVQLITFHIKISTEPSVFIISQE